MPGLPVHDHVPVPQKEAKALKNDEVDRILARLIDLCHEDKELHDAVVDLVKSHAEHNRISTRLKEWRLKKLESRA